MYTKILSVLIGMALFLLLGYAAMPVLAQGPGDELNPHGPGGDVGVEDVEPLMDADGEVIRICPGGSEVDEILPDGGHTCVCPGLTEWGCAIDGGCGMCFDGWNQIGSILGTLCGIDPTLFICGGDGGGPPVQKPPPPPPDDNKPCEKCEKTAQRRRDYAHQNGMDRCQAVWEDSSFQTCNGQNINCAGQPAFTDDMFHPRLQWAHGPYCEGYGYIRDTAGADLEILKEGCRLYHVRKCVNECMAGTPGRTDSWSANISLSFFGVSGGLGTSTSVTVSPTKGYDEACRLAKDIAIGKIEDKAKKCREENCRTGQNNSNQSTPTSIPGDLSDLTIVEGMFEQLTIDVINLGTTTQQLIDHVNEFGVITATFYYADD